ncbi:MAG TPA: ABC transporter ATP-binding protein [Atopostipes sp.]|nr:ABC transporter ATP-binding protein [Atopostipes sp.]
MLKVNNVSHAFGENQILDNVSFEANQGDIIGLVAPNGTGKTTLLNILMNFLSPQDGHVSIALENEELDYSTIKRSVQMHRQIIFLPELEDLYDQMTGRDHLELYAKLWQKTTDHVPGIIEKLNIDSYVNNKVHTYSLGMRQRLSFAMLLCADPPIMLMDEVMNGLDPDNIDLLTGILLELRENGKVILIASHLLDNLDIYATRVMFLKDGQVVFLDDELTQQPFLKIEVGETSQEELSKKELWPEGSHLFENHLLAIPVKDKNEQEVSTLVERALINGFTKLSIGQVGTSEWYGEFYGK